MSVGAYQHNGSVKNCTEYLAANSPQPIHPEASGDDFKFINRAPEDKEWTAHIKLLNEWGIPERHLRDIIQYARSGPFYPADMHVNLIEQLIAQRDQQRLAAVLGALSEKQDEHPIDPETGAAVEVYGYEAVYNQAIDECTKAITATLAPDTTNGVEEKEI